MPTLTPRLSSLGSLTSTAFQPLYGRFSDIFGRSVHCLLDPCARLGAPVDLTLSNARASSSQQGERRRTSLSVARRTLTDLAHPFSQYTLIFALSLFMCGSLGSALSKTMIQLICLRALTGMVSPAVPLRFIRVRSTLTRNLDVGSQGGGAVIT